MQARDVDPRDITWEATPSLYRVYFWSTNGCVSDEHELSDVSDVREVLEWAYQNAHDPVAEIFVRHDDDRRQPGLIRLAGHRPRVV